jgi:hypothetical protein
LSTENACLDVDVPKPDPRLLAVKKRLDGRCEHPRRATLSHADKGALRLEVEGRVIEAATEDELLSQVSGKR